MGNYCNGNSLQLRDSRGSLLMSLNHKKKTEAEAQNTAGKQQWEPDFCKEQHRMPLPCLVQDNWSLRRSLIFAAGHINTQPGSVLALAVCCVYQVTNSHSVVLSYIYPLAEYLCAW